jgi:hypothetical protein
MKNIFKPHGYYYLCQFIGTLAFGSFISAFDHEPASAVTIIKFVINILMIPLISHFIIRNTIKKNSNHGYFNIKMYVSVILLATLTLYITIQTLEFLFSFIMDDITIKKDVSFGKSMASGVLIYTAWCLLYIAITSVRDKITLTHQLKEQQLASLMNQVNPHFLFNSLNTIRGMIYEDKDKAADLITQFANLFRYNLSLGKKTTTTLAAELKICQQYLAIESIRLGNRLQLDIDVCPESYPYKIPIMGLLALVENAIKHGIAPLKEGGTLTIRSRVSKSVLTIEVINPYDQRFVTSGTQIGLVNLEKRVQLLFSGQGKLSTENKDNIFHVSLQLPCEANNND